MKDLKGNKLIGDIVLFVETFIYLNRMVGPCYHQNIDSLSHFSQTFNDIFFTIITGIILNIIPQKKYIAPRNVTELMAENESGDKK